MENWSFFTHDINIPPMTTLAIAAMNQALFDHDDELVMRCMATSKWCVYLYLISLMFFFSIVIVVYFVFTVMFVRL